ncbi:MAG: carboxypeptidase regulatory-like domain-containing protein [Pyrinomonadaceae bacterium]|nr:carboxypeptidase regulatory-like domain-containing protein [Pyrinomonadaceae bacterium]
MRNSPLARFWQWRATFFLLSLLLLASMTALGQEPARASRAGVEDSNAGGAASGSITGRVVGDDGRPVADAQVFIFRAFSNFSGRGSVTDSAGRFQFKELSPGLYLLRAGSAGFIELPDENRNPLEPRYFRLGETAQLTLVKGGVITGTVMNAQGEPMTGAIVRVIRVRDAQGRKLTLEGGASGAPRMTDDRGVYRIYGLQPGSYIVVVGGGNPYFLGTMGLYDGDTPTYYPSSTRDTAVEVMVRAGDEATGVDIRYRGERGHTISGTILGSATGNFSYLGVALTRVTTGILEAQTYSPSVDGKRVFSLNGVPDGEYEITAQNTLEKGETLASMPRRVTVRGTDVTGLELQLSPLASISGRVVLEPLPKEAACVTQTSAQLAMQQTLVTARREEQDKERIQVAQFFSGGNVPDEQGEFSIRNLSDGLFRVSVRLPGDDWYVRAATFPTPARATTEPARLAATKAAPATKAPPAPSLAPGTVATRRGERTSGIVINLAQGAATLRGRVTTQAEGATLPANLRVYLVPAERERADDVLRYAETAPAADGSFAFTSLAPGRYLIAVLSAPPPTEYLRPPRMLAWDEESRKALRREAEAANNALELKPCQQLKDYALSYAAK